MVEDIASLLRAAEPTLITRLGFTELAVLQGIESGSLNVMTRFQAWTGAGIWPPTKHSFEVFSENYWRAIWRSDLVGYWTGSQLDYLIGHSDPLVSLPRFEPASEFDPISYPKEVAEDCWTSALEGRRIAVIHPMTDSIRLQSAKLKLMHKKTRLDFQVTGIISPPLTNGLRVAGLPFGAQLGLFEKKVSRFIEQSCPDIVLVAAGAYGAPIAHYIFSLGVTAFQMGGSLQLLFGIMGNRWRNSMLVQNQVTEHWLSKPLEARPTGSILIEGSTYW